ncbi:hypothetical protein K439DRAFT_1614159 [Ramaria rubella]|nr:hypothetical protein K439DRAFT_1614159 [Ramaria rubella]
MSTTVASSTPLKTTTNSTSVDRVPTDETCDKTTTRGNLPSDHPDESAPTTNGYTENASTESGVTLPTASDTPPHNVHTEHTLTEPENHDGIVNITTGAGRDHDIHVHSDPCAPQTSQQCQEHGPQRSTQGTDGDNTHSSQPRMTTAAATPDIQAAHTRRDTEPHKPETTQQHCQHDILCTAPVASCNTTRVPDTALHTPFPTTPRRCPRAFSAPPAPHRDAQAEDLETGPTIVDERTSAGPSQPNDHCHHCGTRTPGSYTTSRTTTTTPVPPCPTVTQVTIQTCTLTDNKHAQTRTYNDAVTQTTTPTPVPSHPTTAHATTQTDLPADDEHAQVHTYNAHITQTATPTTIATPTANGKRTCMHTQSTAAMQTSTTYSRRTRSHTVDQTTTTSQRMTPTQACVVIQLPALTPLRQLVHTQMNTNDERGDVPKEATRRVAQLNWADEVEREEKMYSNPIPKPTPAPHNISCLRSDNRQPWRGLQRRNKQ